MLERPQDPLTSSAALITKITLPLLVLLLLALVVGLIVQGPSVRVVLAITVVSLLVAGNARRQLRGRVQA